MSNATSQSVELYGAVRDDTDLLYERACSLYLDYLDEHGKAPRLPQVADRLVEAHPDEYPSSSGVLRALTEDSFHKELRLRRKEHLLTNLGPRLFMAEMATSIGREALEETIDRLKDPETRREISVRDLNSIIKTASELALAADKDVEEVAQSTAVNKGTVYNFINQFASPERAAVVLQEMARLQAAQDRQDA